MTRSFRLGLFIVAALVIGAAGILVIGSQQMRFVSTYRLRTHFQDVIGLQTGADVRVGGVREGTVKRIDLPTQPKGDVTVQMDLDRGTRGVVNRASVASIKSEGLVGDTYVEISFGREGAGEVKDGDTIQSEPPIDFTDLIKKANGILSTADEAMRNVTGTTRDLQAVASKIDEGKGTVGALINSPDLYRRANAGVTAFQEDMEALKHNILLRGFFKQRGYEDETELAKHRIARLPAGPPLADYAYNPAKLFTRDDSAAMKNPGIVNQAGHFLESNGFGVAVVAVSTGPVGDTEKMRTLSEARATAIRQYLADHFRFDDTRLKILPIGKTPQNGDAAKVEIIAFPERR